MNQPAPATLTTHADVLVGPPDFAPDRRPFLSLADELNDRAADAGSRSAALAGRDLDDWAQDLLQRAYETVSPPGAYPRHPRSGKAGPGPSPCLIIAPW